MVMKVFDFFSGCGGTSMGFKQAGMEIVWAIDNNQYAAETFRQNFSDVQFEECKLEDFDIESLQSVIDGCHESPLLFSGCAPCQPYSQQNKQDDPDDDRRALLDQFGKYVEKYQPHYVFVENVPGLQRINPDEDSPFARFLKMLKDNKYHYKHGIVAAQTYGVPQKRRRLVLIASRLWPIQFPAKTHGRGTSNPKYSTVEEWIRKFPEISAGETHSQIPNHQAAKISELNLERLRKTPPDGGDRRAWPEHLRLRCHSDYEGHTDVYGRMRWESLASCLTTKCTSISNGRFGHPDQDRAISAREAASLQTFPDDFVFVGGTGATARQVGNAVPVLLAKRFGENFVQHYQACSSEIING